MAELAMAAFTALAPAATTAGTAAATAGTAATALGGLSTAASILQGVATIGSVLAGFSSASQAKLSGEAAMQEASFNAGMARVEASSEAAASANRANDLRRAALQKMGAARVAFAGSGLDISSGQLDAMEGDIANQTAYGLQIEKDNTRLSQAASEARAGQYLTRGMASRTAADARSSADMFGALGSGAKGLLSIIKRG